MIPIIMPISVGRSLGSGPVTTELAGVLEAAGPAGVGVGSDGLAEVTNEVATVVSLSTTVVDIGVPVLVVIGNGIT